MIAETTYPRGHPYSWPVIGSMEDLDAATLDDVRDWFKTYYGPSNAVVSVAGDVDAAEIVDKTMDFDGLQSCGSSLGTGAMVVMDETTCMVQMLRRISRFYFAESCGQCTPCREGTGWMHRLLQRIVDGEAGREDLELLRSAAGQIEGHTICAFGEAAAWPVQGMLRHFWDEFEFYVDHGRSIVDAVPEQAA